MDNYGNLRSLQEQAEGFSEGSYLDGGPSVPSSGKPTQLAYCAPDKTTGLLKKRSLSGMTYKPLMEYLGEAVLMSFLEAFPVRISVVQEKEQASKGCDLRCGSTWRESSEKFDLDTHTWKTHQCLWDEDLQPSSVILPKWGMMLSGVLWERTTLPHLTSGTGSGSWATPTTMDTLPPKSEKALLREATEVRPGRSKPGNLRDQVSNMKSWPTPRAQEPGTTTEGYGRGLAELVEGKEQRQKWPTPTATERSGVNPNCPEKIQGLTQAVKSWPTPTARDYKCVSPDGDYRDGKLKTDYVDRAVHAVSDGNSNGLLSPDWVEWLMGWPIGWTSLEPITDLDWRDWNTDPADELPSIVITQQVKIRDKVGSGSIPRVAKGIKCRADRLKAIGNGQVPQVAAMAWKILTSSHHPNFFL